MAGVSPESLAHSVVAALSPSTASALCGRDKERSYIRNAMETCVPGCLYVYGPPGTGKTSVVRSVASEVAALGRPIEYAYVNCVQLSKPDALFTSLCQQLRVSPKPSAEAALQKRLAGAPETHPFVVAVIDEVDALFVGPAERRALYAAFNMPLAPQSRVAVVGIANTAHPPAQLWKKLRSRIGIQRVAFLPYGPASLEQIVWSRLSEAPGLSAESARAALPQSVVSAIAARLSGICGDARRMLLLCRAALETALASGRCCAGSADVDSVVEEMLMDTRSVGIASLPAHLQVALAVIVRHSAATGKGSAEMGPLCQAVLEACARCGAACPQAEDLAAEIVGVLVSVGLARVEDGLAPAPRYQRLALCVDTDMLFGALNYAPAQALL
eukprot:m51a1_g11851 putative origin recognition complex subunit 1 (386) ;mRNA; f:489043-490303